MKKISCLMLLALLFILCACRTENLIEENPSPNHLNISSRKVLPEEFIKISGLNAKFKKTENIFKNKISTGKNILEEAVIDSSYAMETTDGIVISYTFPVYRNNQGNFFENLVLLKKIGETNFKSYLYKYYRVGTNNFDAKNIEIYNITDVPQSTNEKINYITTSSVTGCYEFQTTVADCGFAGHHTNGQYCPQAGAYMPYNSLMVFDNCPQSGGGGGNGSNNTDPNNPSPGSSPNINYGVTTPVPNYPKWGICKERTGTHWNALDLNTVQLSFINSSSQNALRGEMVAFLANNELFTADCSSSPSISPEVKAVGLWIVNYAMTNPDFLQSEFWSTFVNSDFQLQQWSANFLTQNPTTTWAQFQNWFMTQSEGQDFYYDENYWEDPNLSFPAQTLPSWSAFSSAYPNQTSAQMYGVVGGAVAQAQIDYPLQTQNGCALKVSRALNYSGVVIPNIPGKTLKGADNKNYFLNAKALNAWMRKTFGISPNNPKHENFTKLDGGINGKNFPNLFKNKKGIFSIVSPTLSTWASGHADILYPNGTCKAGCHFFDGDILYIDFWELN